MRVVIIGAGVMGLASAFELLEDGHDVTIFEAAPAPGGLAGSFNFAGISVEKFYHFICGGDRVYFRWLERLGLKDRIRWSRTRMAIFYQGGLHPFGDPVSLLRFSPIPMTARVRYGLHMLAAQRRKDWRPLESIKARDWLVEGEGDAPYRVIWQPLLERKFHAHTESISAAWIWSRIHRLGSSRDRLFREWLGYVDGGSQVLVDALVEAITARGGIIRCGSPVESIHLSNGLVSGVRAGTMDHAADALLSTIPLPILARIGVTLPREYVEAALDLENIGVRCIVLKLRRSLTPYFWVNVNDELPICGLIEYTNLNPSEAFAGHSLVYSPHYVTASDSEYRRPDEEVFEETVEAISHLVSDFDPASVVDYRVFRAPYAQPVCPVGFTHRLAPTRTPVSNLVAGDTTHLLPHDRSISDSLALAERLTGELREVIAGLKRKGVA